MLRALFILFAPFASAISLSCLNEQGTPVDMWAAIKAPAGTNYLFYEPGQTLAPSPYSLNDTTKGALAYTTKQIWSSDSYVIYNDDPPGNAPYSYTYGHTKGYFALASDLTGFYITHSIPNYPVGPKNSTKYLGLGGNAYTYAQNIMCLSVNASTLNALAYKFLLNRPQIYDFKLSTSISQDYQNITNLVKGKYTASPVCADQILQTLGGTPFTIFAKTKQWNADLYDACVAPRFASDLWVESWIRGSAEGPDCPVTGYDTFDIQTLDFGSGFAWSETNDHSKWAIAINESMVCMGDINRMTSQFSRGGGTACLTNKILFTALVNATTKKNSC